MNAYSCAFCGADDAGRGFFESPINRYIGICRYCARKAVRWHGEIPDPKPAAVIPLRPIVGFPEPEPAA